MSESPDNQKVVKPIQLLTIIMPTKSFLNWMDCYKELASEGRMTFSKKGIELANMDSSHIGLYHLVINHADCSTYDLKCAEQTSLGINFEDLSKILKIIKIQLVKHNRKQEVIRKGKNLDLKVEFWNKYIVFSSDMGKLKLKTVDIDIEQINIESLENMKYENHYTIEKEELIYYTRTLLTISEVVQISTKDDQLLFSCDSSIGEAEIVIPFVDVKKKDDFKISVALQYLHKFTKKISKFVKTNIEMWGKNEAPLKLRVSYGKSILTYYLAPRVEETGEDD